jgi:hypothetical protein
MKFIIPIFVFIFPFVAQAQVTKCDTISDLNKEIIRVLEPFKGKKIDRGECWDVVKFALNKTGASWDGLDDFGQEYDYKKGCVAPGDVIRFEKVELEWKDDKGMSYSETFYHHYAIVYSVSEDGVMKIIHQNTGQFGRKVGITPFDVSNMKKGKLFFFRPEAN